jgi:hypothetical protein
MFLIFMLAYSHLIPKVVTGDTKQHGRITRHYPACMMRVAALRPPCA